MTGASLSRSDHWRSLAVAVVLLITCAVVLLAMGREPICTCGDIKLWHGVVFSNENSQHISDWYTPSHIIHGFIFYGLTWLVARNWSISVRLAIAMLVEGAWEIVENTDAVINHYRSVTISLDYYGDSVLNSVCDILAMVAGFFLAQKLPILATVIIAVAFELFTGYMVRDNLILNVIMLLWPMDWIKEWQAAKEPVAELSCMLLSATQNESGVGLFHCKA